MIYFSLLKYLYFKKYSLDTQHDTQYVFSMSMNLSVSAAINSVVLGFKGEGRMQ